MNDEASIVKKTESAFDDLADLWRRRKAVCILVLVVIVFPVGFTLYQHFIAIPRLQDDVNTKEALIEDLKRERDKLDIKLASFQAAADRAFPDKKREERLDLLLNLLDQIGQNLQRALPYQLSDAQRVTLGAQISDIVKQEMSRTQKPPALHFLKFPGQSADASELMDFLQTTFQQAGRKAEIHTNLGVTGITTDGKSWSGVILSMNDLKKPPFVAQTIYQILMKQGLQVHTHEGSGYGENAVVLWAHRLAYSAKSLKNMGDPTR